MPFLVRNVGENDASAITLLSRQLGYTISEAHTLNSLKAILAGEKQTAFVIISEHEIVGWIHIFKTTRLESGTFGEIGGLVVDKKYRGKGAGKILVAHAKKWCVDNRVGILRVRANVARKEAHLFYAAIGFSETKEQKVFEIQVGPKET